MKTLAADSITTPFEDFLRQSGLGKDTVYKLIANGDLQSIKIGKRRLIVIDSYRRLIDRQLATGAAA